MNMRSRPTLFSIREGKGDQTGKKRASLGILLGILAVAVSPAMVVAEERTCRGDLGGVTVDNLRVPEGATCTLNRTHVKGTIKVGPRATLYARGVRVEGNVQAENARLVSVTQSSRIGGSVQVKQGGSATVLDSSVQGDIQYEANHNSLRANDNDVGGNIQVIGNQAEPKSTATLSKAISSARRTAPVPREGETRPAATKKISARPSS